jgi:hypothetical protein
VRVIVIAPAGGAVKQDGTRLLLNEVVIDQKAAR